MDDFGITGSVLVDVIDWTGETGDRLVYPFDRHGNAIQAGARLTVRPGQQAVFVHDGRIADLFEAGEHVIDASSLPRLAALLGWQDEPPEQFEAEIFFCRSALSEERIWRSRQPMVVRDRGFGLVPTHMHGRFDARVSDPQALVREFVTPEGRFSDVLLNEQLQALIVERVFALIAMDALDVQALQRERARLGETFRQRMAPEFLAFGLDLASLAIDRFNWPRPVAASLPAAPEGVPA